MISHIVLFQPKANLTPSQLGSFALMLTQICRDVPSVKRAVVGRSLDLNPGYSRSMGDKTYSYSAVLEFDDESGLLDYLKNPAHRELGRMFWELCESTIVLETRGINAKTESIDALLGE